MNNDTYAQIVFSVLNRSAQGDSWISLKMENRTHFGGRLGAGGSENKRDQMGWNGME